jgi:hypothetical protein
MTSERPTNRKHPNRIRQCNWAEMVAPRTRPLPKNPPNRLSASAAEVLLEYRRLDWGDLVGERFLDGTRPKCRRQSGTGISIIPSFAAFYWYDSFTKTCWRSEMEMVWPTSRPFLRYLFAIWYWWKTWCKGGMGQVTKS